MYAFDAFASYSTDPDYRLVRQTESFLESFHKIGASTGIELKSLEICVDGSDFQVSKRGGKSAGRDTDPVSGLIADNLARSRRLILFCSANAARSPWVEQEIRWFLEHRGPDSILVALTEGRDPGAHPEECFSASAIAAGLHKKPWYDLRQANPASKSWEKVKDLADERVRLAAHLNDRSAGEILPLWRREDRLRQRRRLWITTAVAAVLLVLAAAAVWFGINAERQRRLAMARLLAAQADDRLDNSGDGLQLSLLLATESLRAAWTAEGYASWARAIALAPRRPVEWIDAGGASVVALDHHPDKNWLAMACSDGRIRIMDIDSKSVVQAFSLVDTRLDPPAQWPGAIVKFSPDGAWFAAAASRVLAIWDTSNWHRMDLNANTEGYFDLAFNRDGKRLAATGYGQPFQLFESGSWRKLRLPAGLNTGEFRAIALTDRHLVTAARSGEILFWEYQTDRAQPVEVLRVDFPGDAIHAITLKPNETALAMVMERSGLRLWSAEALEKAFQKINAAGDKVYGNAPLRLNAQELDEQPGSWQAQAPPAHLVEFSRQGDHMVTSAATAGSPLKQFDTAVRLREAASGRELARIQPGGPAAFVNGDVALAIGGANPGVWPLPERGSAGSLTHPSEVLSVAFSPDRRLMAVGLDSATVVVRDSETWAEKFVTTVNGPAESVGFSPDSRWLIVRSGKGPNESLPSLHIYQTETWQAAPAREHEDRFTIYISPDNRYLRTYTPFLQNRYEGLKRASRARIWEIATAKEVAWRSHEKDDRTMTGKISIAEGTLPLGEKGDLSLLEASADWPELRPLSRHPGGMNFGRASADGRWLAGFGGPHAKQGLALLEPSTGRRLVTLRDESALIPDVDFSPDGRWLATAEGTSVDIWLLGPTDALIKEACIRLARNFTAAEWDIFMGGRRRATCDTLRLPEVSAAQSASADNAAEQR